MGEAPLKWLAKKPAVPESDVSGVIEGGDLSDTDFKIGNAVFGIVPAPNMYVSTRFFPALRFSPLLPHSPRPHHALCPSCVLNKLTVLPHIA